MQHHCLILHWGQRILYNMKGKTQHTCSVKTFRQLSQATNLHKENSKQTSIDTVSLDHYTDSDFSCDNNPSNTQPHQHIDKNQEQQQQSPTKAVTTHELCRRHQNTDASKTKRVPANWKRIYTCPLQKKFGRYFMALERRQAMFWNCPGFFSLNALIRSWT